jgi:hypothetical protein
MSEKLKRSKCRIHGHCGCEVCVLNERSWSRKRLSKWRRVRSKALIVEGMEDRYVDIIF